LHSVIATLGKKYEDLKKGGGLKKDVKIKRLRILYILGI